MTTSATTHERKDRDNATISADGVSLFVADAAADGFIDERDTAEFTQWVGRWFVHAGLLADSELNRVIRASQIPEQKRLVLQYARYAKTTNSAAKRSAKLAALGVTPSAMCHWARRYFGPGYLAKCAPTSAPAMVRQYLREYPGSTRRQIVAHAGIPHTSLPGALAHGLKTGTLRRDRTGSQLWRWYVNE